MAVIAPPYLCREAATHGQHFRADTWKVATLLRNVLNSTPVTNRIKPRKSFHSSAKPDFAMDDDWRREWAENPLAGGELVLDPTRMLPGFEPIQQKHWVQANRIRSRCQRTSNLHRWGHTESTQCPACSDVLQDMDRMIFWCPHTAIAGG